MSLVFLRTFGRLRCNRRQITVDCYTKRFSSRTNDSTALGKRETSLPSDVAAQPYQFMTEFYNNPEKFSYEKTFEHPQPDRWRFEKPICLTCVSVLLLYFLAFREENHLDKMLERPLYDTFPYLEQQNLESIIRFLQSEGKDTSEYQKELVKVQKKVAALKK